MKYKNSKRKNAFPGINYFLASIFIINSFAFNSFLDFTIYVNKNEAVISYPNKIKFSVDVEVSTKIKHARLVYGYKSYYCEREFENIVDFDVALKNNVLLEREFLLKDLELIPPNGEIWWIWEFTTSSGETNQLGEKRIRFISENEPWIKIIDSTNEFYLFKNENIFYEDLAKTAFIVKNDFYDKTGFQLEENVKIFLYPSVEEMQDVLCSLYDWIGGMADLKNNSIITGIETNTNNWGKEVIAHEMTHLLICPYTSRNYCELPFWLNEGFATYQEKMFGVSHEFENLIVQIAFDQEELIPISIIGADLGEDEELVDLSYAQSLSIVEYLIETYGEGKIYELFAAQREGYSTYASLMKVYGFSEEGLMDLWTDWIKDKSQVSVVQFEVQEKVFYNYLELIYILFRSLFPFKW